MILDSTSKSIQFVLGSAVATNQLSCVTSWADMTGSTFTSGSTTSQTNNTTAVTIVASPASSTQRQVKGIGIFNADTALATVSVVYNNSSTLFKLVSISLQPGETLQFADDEWSVIDTEGRAQTAAAGGTLAGDADVDITSPANGQVLTYQSSTSKWINGSSAAGSDPWQFKPEDYGAKGDGKVALVSVTSSSSTITSSTPVFTSTAVDGGKNIIICGAQGTPDGPIIDTIDTVISSTQATLTSSTPTVTQSGLAMVFSSDDRTAIDDCIQAATTYALANEYFCQVVLSDKIYGLGSGTYYSNAGSGGAIYTYFTQVRIPTPDVSGHTRKLEFQLVGPADASHETFWDSQVPNLVSGALVSYSSATPDEAGLQPSIVGGPLGGASTGAGGFFNTKVVIKGIQTWQPGWTDMIGFDLNNIAGCRIIGAGSFAFAPSTTSGGGVNPYDAWLSQWWWYSQKNSVGLRVPAPYNNQDTLVESFSVAGLNTGVITGGDGAMFNRVVMVSCDVALKITGVGGTNFHDLIINRMEWENCNSGIYAPDGPGNWISVNITMDSEAFAGSGYDINDANNILQGTIRWSDTFRSPAVPTINGAANVKVINTALHQGMWSSAPSVPVSGTAQKNTAYRDAWVNVQPNSATISAIALDGTTLTGMTSGQVRVPSGRAITLTYTGGTPSWQWVLD